MGVLEMSYEWLSATSEPAALLVAGDELRNYDIPVTEPFALLFGAEDGAVIEGTRDELLDMLDRARQLLVSQPWSDHLPIPGYGEITAYRSPTDDVLVVEIGTTKATEADSTADGAGLPRLRVYVNDGPVWEHPPYPEP